MKQEQVEVGKVYAVKVSGKVQPVRVVSQSKAVMMNRARRSWLGENVLTGRQITIRSAAKLRYEMVEDLNLAAANVWKRKPLQEVVSYKISCVPENSEQVFSFMEDGSIKTRKRVFGADWSKWYKWKLPVQHKDNAAYELYLISLGYVKQEVTCPS